jgi:hypothetical protein
MVRSLLFLALALCAFSQDPAPQPVPSEKAPPEVDEALRARVKQFYQAHVDGKFRIADQVVAEESKDFFFTMAKTKYNGFDIVKINYYQDFTRADVVVATKGTWYFRGEKMPVTMPITSTWKLLDGQWFWYIVPTTEADTPFGKMHFDSGKAREPVAALPADPKVLAEQILNAVKVEQTDIQLSSYEPRSIDVPIRNGVSGPVTLKVEFDNGFAGLSARLAQDKVPGGGSTKVTFACTPRDKQPKPTVTARIHVEPTGQVIPIRITFAIPPELEKLIPKEARPNLDRN